MLSNFPLETVNFIEYINQLQESVLLIGCHECKALEKHIVNPKVVMTFLMANLIPKRELVFRIYLKQEILKNKVKRIIVTGHAHCNFLHREISSCKVSQKYFSHFFRLKSLRDSLRLNNSNTALRDNALSNYNVKAQVRSLIEHPYLGVIIKDEKIKISGITLIDY